MIVLKGLYDSNNKRLMVDFSCSLLQDYFDVFETVTSKYKSLKFLPNGTEIKRVEDSRCLIILPIDIPGTENLNNGDRVTGIPKDVLEKISDMISEFRSSAVQKELETTEFIPLTGYPLDDLKSDIVEAIKNKRNLCIIDDYSNYKKFSRQEITKIQQYRIKYSSNDYSEVALYIYEGNLKELRNIYSKKLEEVDWE